MSRIKRRGDLIPTLPSWVPPEAWSGWLEMRRAKRVPSTERALAVSLAKLGRLAAVGEDPEKVIDQSTERGWTTFWPYRDTAAPLPAAERRNADVARRWAGRKP